MNCPCGSSLTFADCCEPLLAGNLTGKSPEQVMRARYTAFVRGDVDFLLETLLPETRKEVNRKDLEAWSREAKWQGLKVIRADGAEVEFLATYEFQGKQVEHHEVSQFAERNGRWYFASGEHHEHVDGQGHVEPQQPFKRGEAKVGRNDPCPCGSGKKFKKCCAA